MKEKLEAIRQVLDAIEVRGAVNLRYLLSCINSVDDILLQLKQERKQEQGKERAAE